MRLTFLSCCLSLLLAQAHGQSVNDTFHIYFDLNIPSLNDSAKIKIDRLIYNDHILPRTDILIVGYADYLGAEGYNKDLSLHRAQNIMGYLNQDGIDKKNVKLCIGEGEVKRKGQHNADGYPTDRRVDIVIKKKMLPVTGIKKTIGSVKAKMPSKNSIPNIDKYKPGETFVLEKIYFYAQSHRVKPESLPQLETLYETLNSHPSLKIRIEGHVCCIVDYPDAIDMDNGQMNLSENRAKAIYDYLVEKGIAAERLKYIGFGHSKPIVKDERTEEEADKNRRVEIRIMEK